MLACLRRHNLSFTIDWIKSGEPFLTSSGNLLKVCQNTIKKVIGISTELSTSGGTSDGRFIAPYGVELIELGPVNATIHKVNESVNVADLDVLADLYYEILYWFVSRHTLK